MNAGKQFEAEIKNSVPDGVFFYRFRDGTGNFSGGKNENVRFQQSNICDCMMYNKNLYLLELKSHAGKSLPLSAIRENQIKELSKVETYEGIIAGLLINFRDIEKTYFVKIDNILYFMAHEERKSIPVSWCEQWGTEIKGRKLRVHYRWDLKEWMEGMK
jgi:recombination protein U